MSVQTTEQKKEEFRKYLEKAGVIDQLTKVLVGLYEEQEKPQNVIEFIKKSLGEPTDTDVEQLLAENEALKRDKMDLQKKIDDLTRELENERSGNQGDGFRLAMMPDGGNKPRDVGLEHKEPWELTPNLGQSQFFNLTGMLAPSGLREVTSVGSVWHPMGVGNKRPWTGILCRRCLCWVRHYDNVTGLKFIRQPLPAQRCEASTREGAQAIKRANSELPIKTPPVFFCPA